MKKIAFTGHRPQTLGGGYDWNTKINQRIIKLIKDEVSKQLQTDDEFDFIVGGALGIDQMAFAVCQELKAEHPEIKISCEIAVPFAGQPNAWRSKVDKDRYFDQIAIADKVVYVDKLPYYGSDKSVGQKLQLRNIYMVDNCDLLIAVYNGDITGGTANCVNYAIKKEKEIVTIDPRDDREIKEDLTVIKGNILDIAEGVIVHQGNNCGIMGAGIAKQIIERHVQVFKDYFSEYKNQLELYDNLNKQKFYGKKAIKEWLGDGIITKITDSLSVLTIIAQDGLGSGGCYTDYSAFRKCLEDIKKSYEQANGEVKFYMPYGIGANLAGGEWVIIEDMIKEICPFVILVKYERGGK